MLYQQTHESGKLHSDMGWGDRDSLHRLASANDIPRLGPTVFPLQAAPAHLQLGQLDVA